MKEIKSIVKAYEMAVQNGEASALATVVKVDGSSYRRPGARMLVTENGQLTGAISGGCLEGDALKKAQMVIFSEKSMLVTYDTTDEDDAKFGVGLGCNGIIHILIEPILPNTENNPIALLKQTLENREDKVIVTFFDTQKKRAPQTGTCMLFPGNGFLTNANLDSLQQPSIEFVRKKAEKVLDQRQSLIVPVEATDTLQAFVEFIAAPVQLLVIGAGNDVIPLTQLASVMGWELILVDGRSDYATKSRFPMAAQLLVGKAAEILPELRPDRRTAVLLMTHNFTYDLAIMSGLHPYQFPYLGVLGPKKKLEKLIENLEKEGIHLSSGDLQRIYGPMGLNIGAESPEEIALSVISEVSAVLSSQEPMHLRSKPGPIHADENFHG
ncbi:Xanthine and CO dehydrogenase maturation factor, XdhC/CoxF family [Cyclobacterium xiamenense]|uniref:Xanthine and CO dehydrogenase maturation factor, XdhC/CoxF family n=1 Tax=Cyclobacterium xiamenense TaxID=1297121 RepID=A0A1H6UIN2_9BACT|nr:XdhC/CoxI family protein [Cyclobacterium xiamenense]SEI92173.1 Xanthine and CO dehydrogenase maturation factor, XdhC/CoxF family [Cyclobacterium xiamenense]